MSNYMSIQDGDVKREIARAMGEALFKRNGYEILQGCFDSSELHSFIVARDPEDGALVLAECHLVDEFESEGLTNRCVCERAAYDWLYVNPDTADSAIRFDEIQVCQIGDTGKGLLKHVINVLGKSA